ncbi:MAG: helix-turn-helix transcriptional regulator [Mojavia pulchra JT2-VF2]|jgi:DNA-binding CsgD family transcriptional regulator|uniref:Helix-turn-helix transcriptional regulator n=1 Tax=Mojavia pulchra JT2-VF2 TaxID=287848 RepID=A0A951PV45_9NOST|nr:helix-turn-helix transcriptional regulator [Mojavia pulchra JT2-VF2]
MLVTTEKTNLISASIVSNKFNTTSVKDHNLQIDLLKAMIESFADGILILSTESELVHANEYARYICRQLMPKEAASNAVPQEIWRVCQSLIESRELFPEEKIIIESEIERDSTVKLRIRARWLQMGASQYNFLLVTIEDCYQYSQSLAIADAKKYHLTNRETEVWLLRRANLSYREIANRLYITINTVKKHLKNIHAKQQETENFNEHKLAKLEGLRHFC